MQKTNPQLIVIARESKMKSQEELANEIGVEQGTLSKIENGLLEPSERIINSIANATEVLPSFFSQAWSADRVEGHYRRVLSKSAKELKSALAKMTFAERHFSILSNSVVHNPPTYPTWNVEEDGSPELCARFIRNHYNIKGRVDNLTDFLEKIGFIIIELNLGDVDGYGTVSGNGYPIIFVNKNKPGDRDNFSKAHELFHFIAHYGQKTSPERELDNEANDFASEFLLPEDLIRPHLNKLTLSKLQELKVYWKVSMQAILYKAKKIGAITPNQGRYLWSQLVAKGYKKEEPVKIERTNATLMADLVRLHTEQLGYQEKELEEILHFPYQRIEEWYFNKRKSLRFSINQANNLRKYK